MMPVQVRSSQVVAAKRRGLLSSLRPGELTPKLAREVYANAGRETGMRLRDYETSSAYSGPTRIGRIATSSIREVGDVPASFAKLVSADDAFVIGIAVKVTDDGISRDEKLAELLIREAGLVFLPWDPERKNPKIQHLTEEQSEALGEAVKVAIQDFRGKSGFTGPLQVYGQIKKYDDKALTGQEVSARAGKSPYNDLVPHLDFIPANVPDASVYFTANLNPTVAFSGNFPFRGYLETEYSKEKEKMTAVPMQAGKIYASDHPDTLLHAAHKTEDGKRVFIRIYVGPDLSRLAETLQLINSSLPLEGAVRPVLTTEERVRLTVNR